MRNFLCGLSLASASVLAPVASASPWTTTYSGTCDASAGVALDSDLFLIANDEDNALRVYHRNGSTSPVQFFAMDDFLDVDPDQPEADIEAATTLNGRTYWITSHGRNKDGEERPGRRRFWATEQRIVNGRVRLQTVGEAYKDLLQDLIRSPNLRLYDLDSASRRIPEAPGGLNIEGLAATADGSGLLIGFRNPVPLGHALLVPLLNPDDVLVGGRAIFGDPIELDLGGLGIRTIQYSEDRGAYLIVAGAYDSAQQFALYAWSGAAQSRPRLLASLQGDLRPEEIILWPAEAGVVQLVSDDGDRRVHGKKCKELDNAEQRLFRSMTLDIGADR